MARTPSTTSTRTYPAGEDAGSADVGQENPHVQRSRDQHGTRGDGAPDGGTDTARGAHQGRRQKLEARHRHKKQKALMYSNQIHGAGHVPRCPPHEQFRIREARKPSTLAQASGDGGVCGPEVIALTAGATTVHEGEDVADADSGFGAAHMHRASVQRVKQQRMCHQQAEKEKSTKPPRNKKPFKRGTTETVKLWWRPTLARRRAQETAVRVGTWRQRPRQLCRLLGLHG